MHIDVKNISRTMACSRYMHVRTLVRNQSKYNTCHMLLILNGSVISDVFSISAKVGISEQYEAEVINLLLVVNISDHH